MDKAKSALVKFWLRKAQRDLAVAQKLASDFPDIAIGTGYNSPCTWSS